MTPPSRSRSPRVARQKGHLLAFWAKGCSKGCQLVLSISPDPRWKEMESIWELSASVLPHFSIGSGFIFPNGRARIIGGRMMPSVKSLRDVFTGIAFRRAEHDVSNERSIVPSPCHLLRRGRHPPVTCAGPASALNTPAQQI